MGKTSPLMTSLQDVCGLLKIDEWGTLCHNEFYIYGTTKEEAFTAIYKSFILSKHF